MVCNRTSVAVSLEINASFSFIIVSTVAFSPSGLFGSASVFGRGLAADRVGVCFPRTRIDALSAPGSVTQSDPSASQLESPCCDLAFLAKENLEARLCVAFGNASFGAVSCCPVGDPRSKGRLDFSITSPRICKDGLPSASVGGGVEEAGSAGQFFKLATDSQGDLGTTLVKHRDSPCQR